MKTNITAVNTVKTHEGAHAIPNLKPEAQLRRTVLSCFLWEKTFYEEGLDVSTRIEETAKLVAPEVIAALAIECRTVHNLRHVSLLLAAVLAKTTKGKIVKETIRDVICRADELAEFLSVYAIVNNVSPSAVKKKISAQVKKGLALAFKKFNAYQLAKYDRPSAIKLRDVLFLCHAKPQDEAQARVWKELVEGTLSSPDTWEVALSTGGNKKDVFTRLIQEKKLGYFALLRNLRNMVEAGVDQELITVALRETPGSEKILPFRYVAVAKACPSLELQLDVQMLKAIALLPKLEGNTAVLVDVSGSMTESLSQKSDMTRMIAAAALASIINSDRLRVFTFSSKIVEVPPRKGIAGVDSIIRSQEHSSTDLRGAIAALMMNGVLQGADRFIVITDEQVNSSNLAEIPVEKCYLINVGTYKNGIGYGRPWVHIDGFSENVIKFIHEYEKTGGGE